MYSECTCTVTFVVERPFPDTDTDLMVYDRFGSRQRTVLQTSSELAAHNIQLHQVSHNISYLGCKFLD